MSLRLRLNGQLLLSLVSVACGGRDAAPTSQRFAAPIPNAPAVSVEPAPSQEISQPIASAPAAPPALVLDASAGLSSESKTVKLRKRWQRELGFERGDSLLFADKGDALTLVHIAGEGLASSAPTRPILERWAGDGHKLGEWVAPVMFFVDARPGQGGDLWLTGVVDRKATFGAATITPRGATDSFVARLDAKNQWRFAALLDEKRPDDPWRLVGDNGERVLLFDPRPKMMLNVLTGATAECASLRDVGPANSLAPVGVGQPQRVMRLAGGDWVVQEDALLHRLGRTFSPRFARRLPLGFRVLAGLADDLLVGGTATSPDGHVAIVFARIGPDGEQRWQRAFRGKLEHAGENTVAGIASVAVTPEGTIVALLDLGRLDGAKLDAFSSPSGEPLALVELDDVGSLTWAAPVTAKVPCVRTAWTPVSFRLVATTSAVAFSYHCAAQSVGTCINSLNPNCSTMSAQGSGLLMFDRPKR